MVRMPSPLQLSSSIESAPMVGLTRGKVFREHGIRTVEDLLWVLPFRYEDWRRKKSIGDLQDGERLTVEGTVVRSHLAVTARKRFKILDVTVADATGRLQVRFFNQPYLADTFSKGNRILLHGDVKIEPMARVPVIENPHYEILKERPATEFLKIRPVYERIGSITTKMLRWMIQTCLGQLPAAAFGEPFSPELLKKYKLVDRKTAFQELHFPEDD